MTAKKWRETIRKLREPVGQVKQGSAASYSFSQWVLMRARNPKTQENGARLPVFPTFRRPLATHLDLTSPVPALHHQPHPSLTGRPVDLRCLPFMLRSTR